MLRRSFILLLFALVSSPAGGVEPSDPQLRADVEKYCRSLKAAYDSGDRAKVLSHFQHGDLITPTESEYAMLGQIRFWEKPIREIQTKDGVISVTFTLDPQSDSPAQFLTVELIRNSDGTLMMKSSATPEQFQAAKERKKKEAESVRDIAALARELETRKKVEHWLLLERYVQESATGPSVPLPAEAQVFALAELNGAEEAVLIALVGMYDDVIPAAVRFEKKEGVWSLQQRFADEDEIEKLLRSPGVRIVRRPAGLPLESMPLFILHLLRDQAPKFREAEQRHDFKTCAALADQMLIGFGLNNTERLLSTLRSQSTVANVTLSTKTQQPDGRLLAAFVVETEYGPSTFRYFLAKEGNGWVIDEPYSGRARRTMSVVRNLAVAMEAYNIDHDEHYPPAASLDELRRLLQPKYMRPVPLTDAWGTPIRFEVWKDRKGYRLISAGADGKFAPKSWPTQSQDLADFSEDLVFENGTFVRVWRISD